MEKEIINLSYSTVSPLLLKVVLKHNLLNLYKVDLCLFNVNVNFDKTCICTYSRHRYQVNVLQNVIKKSSSQVDDADTLHTCL